MIASDIISSLIPPLKPQDTTEDALKMMQEFSITHLPIIKDDKLVALISEENIMDISEEEAKIEALLPNLNTTFVPETAHLFEIIRIASEAHLSLIPVVDDEDNYLGSITLENIILCFADLSSVRENGGILTIEMNKSDYSMSEIGRIVESNNGYILSSYVSATKDSTKIQVTLKLNVSDIKQIVATFERFDYNIIGSYQKEEYVEDIKERYQSFIKYLNV